MNKLKFEPEAGCTFPDCGCAEARLCVGGEPNTGALSINRPKRRVAGRVCTDATARVHTRPEKGA